MKDIRFPVEGEIFRYERQEVYLTHIVLEMRKQTALLERLVEVMTPHEIVAELVSMPGVIEAEIDKQKPAQKRRRK